MVFDFTQLMGSVDKTKEKRDSIASDRSKLKVPHKPSSDRPSSNSKSEKSSSDSSKRPSKSSSSDSHSKKPSSSTRHVIESDQSTRKKPSSSISNQDAPSKQTFRIPKKPAPQIDPARVQEFLKKKQREEDEERKRQDQKRHLQDSRGTKEKEKSEKSIESGAKRRKIDGESDGNRGGQSIDRSDQRSSKDKEKHKSSGGSKSDKPKNGEHKSSTSNFEEPAPKKRKIDESERKVDSKRPSGYPSSSTQNPPLKSLSTPLKRDPLHPSSSSSRTESMDRKSTDHRTIDSKKSTSSTTIDHHLTLKKNGTDSKSAQITSLFHKSKIEKAPKLNSTALQAAAAARIAIPGKPVNLPSKNSVGNSATTSQRNVMGQKNLGNSNSTSTGGHKNAGYSNSASGKTTDSQGQKNVGNSKSTSISISNMASQKNAVQKKSDSINQKSAGGNSNGKSDPKSTKPTPMMAKSMASAAAKSSMMAKPNLPPVRPAKLISAPIFDQPRDEKSNVTNLVRKPISPMEKKPMIPPPRQPGPAYGSGSGLKSGPGLRPGPGPGQGQGPGPKFGPGSGPSTSKPSGRSGGMSQSELFQRKMKLQKEEERARLLALKKLSKNPNWDEDDDEEDEDEEEYDSEMDDFIDDGPMDDGEEDDYSQHIKSIFGYDKSKYRYADDDDLDNMESNWREIQKEEAESARAGLKEDLEELEREQRMEADRRKRKIRR